MATPAEYVLDESGNVVNLLEEQENARAAQEQANESLLAAIRERETMAWGEDTDNVQIERARAIDYYMGRPFGNEIAGRSQVVSKDLYDTVESILPVMQRIFASGDDVCAFSPEAPDDVAAAAQESDYVNYVIQRKNPWFMLAYVWFKDALITRNAYAYVYHARMSEPTLERYQGLTTDQMVLLANDPAVEITGHSQRQIPAPVPAQMALAAMAQGVMQAFPAITVHDVEMRRRREYGCTKICVLPPERCLVANDADSMSVRESSFFEYWDERTISSLRIDGFDVEDDIDDSDSPGEPFGPIDQARDAGNLRYASQDDAIKADPAMRKVKTRCIWIRFDHDGDGIAELRYVVAVGRNMLANEEVATIPVASIVPFPMPHRHLGLSIFDAVHDLQIIKSAMLRAAVDNQFLANNARTAVNENTVNLDDMSVSRPGGTVRVNGPPGPDIMPFVHPNTTPGTMQFLDYLDSIRQDRAGVQKPLAGADMDAIMAQPGTIAQLANAASQKMELIARVFGEGVKELFQIVHEVELTAGGAPQRVQLRGKWATVDPRQWHKRSDMSLMVGMGVGNKQSHAAAISALIGLQKQAVGIGLTDLSKLYAGFAEFTKALGFGNAAQFFTEPPEGTQLPPPPPDPRVVVEGIKAETQKAVEGYKGQVDVLVEQIKAGADAQETRFKEYMQLLDAREERMLRAFSEATERAQELRLANAKSDTPNIKSIAFEGMDEVRAVLEKSTDAIGRVEKSTKALTDSLKESKSKKKTRTVKSSTGKTYTIDSDGD